MPRFTSGGTANSEGYLYVAERLHKRDGTVRGVVFLHTTGALAGQAIDGNYGKAAEALAAAGLPVLSIDAGGATAWSNDAALAKVTAGVAYIKSAFGAKAGTVILVATSMGALTALNWAKANLADVAALALMLPVIDLADMRDNNRAGLAAEINTAYGGAAGFDAAVATHNPAVVPSATVTIPTQLWYRTDDDIALPGPVTTFAAGGSGATATSIGTGGHTLTGFDAAPVVAFALAHAA